MTDSERLAKERWELLRRTAILYSPVCYLTNGKEEFFAVHFNQEIYKEISVKKEGIYDDRK